ncbi:related to cytochrome P450 CYP3/CYP5/CYP6/CYP9 subfamilies [Ramularia collo-cygni]|uniref:Related to cytochrome P450 CYP3/CYP5/CYP6/CYP9 subfamilies n=1 Tax=Ramularia collo-cygni TaxID=112498 RepID=A0A2D3VFA8_9PEZI|nr:related to cytochrome P450 CYP3/CYP5/CYP6/CYP9 subfamilies [Ramularia collo-cygni]CZT22761.1 related to cytochrome P450 CYP3/CYP5/CYP6/CYP9 subfamilies [Ramularia collo-cygni]
MNAYNQLNSMLPSFLDITPIILVAGLYLIIIAPIYNLYFHPLRKFPGPKLYAASKLPWGYHYRKGLWHDKVLQLHKTYGHIVRVAPDELSYDIPEAWEEIYSSGSGRIENHRPEWFVSSKLNFIIGANESDQKRMKSVMAPGFSHAALMEQEPTIKKHLDLFIRQIRQATNDGQKPANLIRWVNYLTFDIIGDLLFGQDFGCVAGDAEMRAWQDVLIGNLQLIHVVAVCKRIWVFWLALPPAQVWTLLTKFKYFDGIIEHRVRSREVTSEEAPKRTDILELMRKGRNSAYMTRKEILANTNLLTFAGSESSANATASLVYRIANNATLRERILQELHDNFQNEDEISSGKAMSLPFLNAVIQEGLRLHPVTPNALWRITPSGGNKVFGDWIPGNTVLSIHHRAMYRAEHNFHRAEEFIPERWMPHSEAYPDFAKDRRDAFHPFSLGARMCPARNLGYAEMSVIIARLLWAFDITIAEESKDWLEGLRAWVLWDKKPFWLFLKPRMQ